MILEFQKLATHFYRGGRSLSMVCGCFDVLTIGHIRHLEAAKRMSSCLLVLITADEHVGKSSSRPAFPQRIRVEMVDSLRCVDYTVVNTYTTAVEAIKLLRPEV